MKKLLKDKHAVTAQLGGMIALLVAIIIGVLVYYSVVGGLGIDTQTYNANATAQLNNTNSTASTVFTLLPIVAIVLIASIILFVVTRFGAGAGGGGVV